MSETADDKRDRERLEILGELHGEVMARDAHVFVTHARNIGRGPDLHAADDHRNPREDHQEKERALPHDRSQAMGREVVVAITKGKLDFGPWEQIFYGEFDGNRNKRVLIKVIGE